MNVLKTSVLALSLAALSLTGCGEKFPEPWDNLGLPTDDMTSAFKDSDQPAVTAIYNSGAKLEGMVTKWDGALKAKGYSSFCETKHDDGSLNRGYENATAKKRYLFTGGKLGEQQELRLLEVPERIPNPEVCPPKS